MRSEAEAANPAIITPLIDVFRREIGLIEDLTDALGDRRRGAVNPGCGGSLLHMQTLVGYGRREPERPKHRTQIGRSAKIGS